MAPDDPVSPEDDPSTPDAAPPDSKTAARLRDPGVVSVAGGRTAEVLLFDLRPNELPSY